MMPVLDLFEHAIQLARSRLVMRTAEDLEILSAVRRNSPISQERSKILWIGKFRLKMKFRQYSI